MISRRFLRGLLGAAPVLPSVYLFLAILIDRRLAFTSVWRGCFLFTLAPCFLLAPLDGAVKTWLALGLSVLWIAALISIAIHAGRKWLPDE